MNILDYYHQITHRTPAKASSAKGGEYCGPCPACGDASRPDSDRFRIWPNQRLGGTFWCRRCGRAGDLIQFRRDFMGEDYNTAAAACGKEADQAATRKARRPPRAQGRPEYRPEEKGPPGAMWSHQAGKLVAWANHHLLSAAGADPRAWLADRGIESEAIECFTLGWNPGDQKSRDLWRDRKAWGLPRELKEGREKKLWIPRGLIIPLMVEDKPWRVRIRRREKTGPRYYVLPGSSMRQMVCPGDLRVAVVVESELDALTVWSACNDLAFAVAMGSSSARPDTEAHKALTAAQTILVALDFDKAGKDAARWWRAHYPSAKRWPVPVGKDPGEAFALGVNLHLWVAAGIPDSVKSDSKTPSV